MVYFAVVVSLKKKKKYDTPPPPLQLMLKIFPYYVDGFQSSIETDVCSVKRSLRVSLLLPFICSACVSFLAVGCAWKFRHLKRSAMVNFLDCKTQCSLFLLTGQCKIPALCALFSPPFPRVEGKPSHLSFQSPFLATHAEENAVSSPQIECAS